MHPKGREGSIDMWVAMQDINYGVSCTFYSLQSVSGEDCWAEQLNAQFSEVDQFELAIE